LKLECITCSKYGKEQHCLWDKNLNNHDCQNYDAVLHIINACSLLEKIRGASATNYYIEIIRNIVDSYEDTSLNGIDRIEENCYANFILRYWHKYIKLKIRDQFEGESRNFLTWKLGSQTCEKKFFEP